MTSTGRSHGARLPAAFILTCLVTGLALLAAAPVAGQADRTVAVTTVEGVITPVIADHLVDTIEDAAADGHEALVVRLDTPGGLLASTRTIVRAFLDAPLPVVVHVAPSGADAGSAGTFITMAAHVAAMAPGTTIGAATPVDLEGGEVGDKQVQNTIAFSEAIAEQRGRDLDFAVEAVRDGRSVTSSTAVEIGAVDLIADSVGDLLAELDGIEVEVRGATVALTTAGAAQIEAELSGTQRLLQLLADPNLAFVFLSIGTLAIIYEIANPGLGLGGVVGVVSIVLAMFSMSVLPVNYAGAALLVLAAAMFIAELFAPGIGVGAAGGTAALLLGGLFLFQTGTGVGVDWWVLIPTALVMFGMAVLAGILVTRTRRQRSPAGGDEMLGRIVTVENTDSGQPWARVGGSFWRLAPEDPATRLRDGDRVTIVDRRSVDLIVARADDPDATDRVDDTSV